MQGSENLHFIINAITNASQLAKHVLNISSCGATAVDVVCAKFAQRLFLF